MDFERIGERMKARRLELGMTLTEVADKVGTSASVVRAWEKGEIKSLKTTKLMQIAAALNTSVEYLLGIPVKYIPRDDILPPSNIKLDADFTVIAPDDSMILARIFKGDEVYVKKQSDVDQGELAVILVNNELMIRRVYKYKYGAELRPENPSYPVIDLEGESFFRDAKIIGKPIAFLGELK